MAVSQSKILKSSKKLASAPPLETASLRRGLHAFSKLKYPDETSVHNIGWFKWGVYIFYDYDREPTTLVKRTKKSADE
jgi:hypothetical protein